MLWNRRHAISFFAACLLMPVWQTGLLAQSRTNFSGTWLEQDSGKAEDRSALTVKQTDDAIEITNTWHGESYISKFPLDGSPGIYRTESGSIGKGLATWKGNDLIIETFVTSPPKDGHAIRFHEKRHWQLSKNGSVLKIHVDTDSPDMPAEIVSIAVQPYTETYKRTSP